MANMLGCLFILLFGFILFALGFIKMIVQLLFGSSATKAKPRATSTTGTGRTHSASGYAAGNAHHETSRGNSRQRRSGKIFRRDEGEYVDFEEIK